MKTIKFYFHCDCREKDSRDRKKMKEDLSKKEVIKHSGVVQVQHKTSLMGQKIFNILLAHAFNDLKTERTHRIEVKELLKYVPSMNATHLRKTLREMCVRVDYNILGKDKKETWGFFALLPFAEIKEGSGICEYSFMDKMIELLANPRMYAKISLLIQKRYSGNKYGWFLYELCFDYKDIGKTPVISIEDLKKYFGIEKTRYTEFNIFRRNVINAAIRDINAQTDLNIRDRTFKTERRITHIQFIFTRKKNFQSLSPLNLEALKPANLKMAKELKAVGVSAAAVKEICEKHSQEEIEEALQSFKEAEEKPRGVQNPTGFMKRALKEGWQSERTRKLEREKRFKEAREAEKDEEKQRAELMKKEEEKYANSDNEERFEYVLENLSGFREVYDALSSHSRDLLKEDVLFIFDNFDSYKSTYKYIMQELQKFK